jgi:hypothetical protein
VRPNNESSPRPNNESLSKNIRPRTETKVTLHVYDLGWQGLILNKFMRPLGTGMFHCGVEAFDWEWSFIELCDAAGSGIVCCRPRWCEGFCYRESIEMGESTMTVDEFRKLVEKLETEWLVDSYELLSRNCCHFSEELCQRLGVGTIPKWVRNLADTGVQVDRKSRVLATQVYDQARTVCRTCPGLDSEEAEEIVQVVQAMPALSGSFPGQNIEEGDEAGEDDAAVNSRRNPVNFRKVPKLDFRPTGPPLAHR